MAADELPEDGAKKTEKKNSSRADDGNSHICSNKASPGRVRKRKVIFSENEKVCLIQEVKHYREILECRGNDSRALEQRTKAWEKIAKTIDPLNPSVKRTTAELKQKWRNMVKESRKEIAKVKQLTGTIVKEDLSLPTQMILGVFENDPSLMEVEQPCEENGSVSSLEVAASPQFHLNSSNNENIHFILPEDLVIATIREDSSGDAENPSSYEEDSFDEPDIPKNNLKRHMMTDSYRSLVAAKIRKTDLESSKIELEKQKLMLEIETMKLQKEKLLLEIQELRRS